MAPLNPAIPPAAVKVFEEKKAALTSGALMPFAGPISDNTGAVKVAANAAMTDKDPTFNSVNWYVQGIDGSALFALNTAISACPFECAPSRCGSVHQDRCGEIPTCWLRAAFDAATQIGRPLNQKQANA